MALVVCLTCGACAWAAAWVLLGTDGAHSGMVSARLAVVRRALGRVVEAAGSTRVVDLLLGHEAFARAVDALAGPAGAAWSRRERAALLALAALLACVLGGLFARSAVGVVVVGTGEALALVLWSASRVRRRTQALAREMPDVLRTLASAVSAGSTLVQAIDYVGLHGGGLVAEAFVRTSLRMRCGMSLDEALTLLEGELQAPGVGLMATGLAISQRTGSPLRDLLQRSAALVERQGEFERTLRVRTAQVRLSVRIVCGLPPLMVGLLSLISPDFQQGLLTTPGMLCLSLAALMDGAALLIIRRIMGGVL